VVRVAVLGVMRAKALVLDWELVCASMPKKMHFWKLGGREFGRELHFIAILVPA